MMNSLFESLTIPVAVTGTILATTDTPSSVVLTMFGVGISAVTGALVYVWRQQVKIMDERTLDANKLGSLEAKSEECDKDRKELRAQIEELKGAK